jgi:perosamine synthetase
MEKVMIPVFRPLMNKEKILSELEKIFDSGWIGLGPKTAEFEEKFAQYVGAKYAVGLNSATSALHLSLQALGIKEGDEVIVPPITFVSTALAPLYCRATPIFADIEEDTLCISPEDIEKKITPRTKAIIPVHFGGHSCRMDEISDLAERHNFAVIEDAAHACGSEYKGIKHGGLERTMMTCFSFHAVKNLPTADGGMITTNDEELYNKLKRLRWVGISKGTWDRASGKSYSWQYDVNEIGFKYHMNDITAVIGLAQLEVLDVHNAIRRQIAERYNKAFERESWIKTPVEKEYTKSARHNYVIQVPMRDELNEFLNSEGISTGVHYEPVNHYKIFGETKLDTPTTENVWKMLLTLPLFPGMTDEEFEKVVAEVKEFGWKNGL